MSLISHVLIGFALDKISKNYSLVTALALIIYLKGMSDMKNTVSATQTRNRRVTIL